MQNIREQEDQRSSVTQFSPVFIFLSTRQTSPRLYQCQPKTLPPVCPQPLPIHAGLGRCLLMWRKGGSQTLAALYPSSCESLCRGVIFTRKSSCGQPSSGSCPALGMRSTDNTLLRHHHVLCRPPCWVPLPAPQHPSCPPASLTPAAAKCPVARGCASGEAAVPCGCHQHPSLSLAPNFQCKHPQWHFCAGPCATHNSQRA